MFYPPIAALLVMAATFAWRFSTLPPQIPLFYSKPQGDDQVVDFWLIAILPILLIVFFTINMIIYRKLFSGDKTILKIIEGVNIAEAIIITLIFMKILFTIT